MSGSVVHDLFLDSQLFVRVPYHLLERYTAVKPLLIQDSSYKTAKWLLTESNMCYWNAVFHFLQPL